MSSTPASPPAAAAVLPRERLRAVVPWLLPVAILVFWEGASAFGWLSTRILPEPLAVVRAFWTLLRSGELLHHVGISTGRALAGLAIGGGVGLALGLLTGTFRRAETLLDTSLQMVRNIPPLALIPLVILWFGIDESAKLFLVSIGVFFPIYLNTFHGIRSVDAGLIEMARSYGLSGWPLYREVILPGALPSILVGLRFSLGLMWVLLIVAETISAQAGIGYMTMNAREFLQTDIVLVGILLYALLGKLADLIARGLERWWLRWHPGYQASARGLTTMETEANMHRELGDPLIGLVPPAPVNGLSIGLRNVAKSFGARAVLEGITLDVPAGEFVAIVGRSGCGKSTLLRLLAGLDATSAGEILLGGRAAAESREDTRIMFQEARLLPWRSVLQNVMLGLPDADAQARAREALAQVGLAERAGDWPSVLSGGQRQRVALARALVHRPRLLLLDEPLGALDALTRIEMQSLIESLWREFRFTAVLVTHDVAEAVALADRVLLVEDRHVSFDEPVPLPRPRSHGAPAFAELEARVLARVLRHPGAPVAQLVPSPLQGIGDEIAPSWRIAV